MCLDLSCNVAGGALGWALVKMVWSKLTELELRALLLGEGIGDGAREDGAAVCRAAAEAVGAPRRRGCRVSARGGAPSSDGRHGMNPNGFQTVLNDRSASVHRRSRPRSRRACECGVAVATAEGELCFLLFRHH